MTKREAQDHMDLSWWEELATALGWRVFGWTRRSSCTYDDLHPGGETLRINAKQREDIMRAIAKAYQKGYEEGCDNGCPSVD